MIPSVFVTAVHHHAGLKRDAASVWIEDVTQSSFKVCLRELQNYAGSHEDVYVVCVVFARIEKFVTWTKTRPLYNLLLSCFIFKESLLH